MAEWIRVSLVVVDANENSFVDSFTALNIKVRILSYSQFKIMAKQIGNPKFTPDLLHTTTMIEVIRTDAKGQNVKKTMTYGEWKEMKKQSGFVYRAFQLGFSKYEL